jgi:hypothetical protein
MKAARVAPWFEIAANLGVIVTLVLLVAEVRNNTLALERQALLDRSAAMNYPFLENPLMAEILADIKAVDGWQGSAYEEASRPGTACRHMTRRGCGRASP